MLQWLDGRSKQAAARTCKRLFHSANHRLAWVGSMHRVRLRIDEPNKLIHLRHPYFLLRHANLCLAVHCSGISNNEAEAFLEQLVTSLTSPPHNLHLHQLDLSYVMMLSSRLCLILQPIHSLRSLHLPRRIWIGSVELHRLTHFPHLCELHAGLDVSALNEDQGADVTGVNEEGARDRPATAATVSQSQLVFPSLTSFHTFIPSHGHGPNIDAMGRVIACMPHLSHLHISVWNSRDSGILPRCWQLPVLRRIPSITMEGFYSPNIDEENEVAQMAAAAANLQSCHTLTIIDGNGMIFMLPRLRHLPSSLHKLIIVGQRHLSSIDFDYLLSLRSLLQHNPHLHVTLQQFQHVAQQEPMLREKMQRIKQEFPTRLTY